MVGNNIQFGPELCSVKILYFGVRQRDICDAIGAYYGESRLSAAKSA
jgi:hypothetical protein